MTTDNQRNLQLRFPAESGYLRVSRLTATTLAADLGFDVDVLDDLRLAVAEVVNYLVESSTAAHVVLRLVADHDGFRLEGTTVGEHDGPDRWAESHQSEARPRQAAAVDDDAVDDLLHAVLGATTDDYRIGLVDDRPYVWLAKQLIDHAERDATDSVDALANEHADGGE